MEGKRSNRDGPQQCKRPQLVLLLVVREEEFSVWEFGRRFFNLVSFNPRSVLRGMESYPTEVYNPGTPQAQMLVDFWLQVITSTSY